MMTILAAALGFWANRHIGMYCTEAGTQNLEIHTQAIAADVRWFWLSLLILCAFTVSAGRNARRFVDTVALPWLSAFGLQLPALPTLPQLPTQDHLTA